MLTAGLVGCGKSGSSSPPTPTTPKSGIADKAAEQRNLQTVGQAYFAYATDHDGHYPDHAEELAPYLGNDLETFLIAEPDTAATVSMTRAPAPILGLYTFGSFTFMPLAGVSDAMISSPSDTPFAFSANLRRGQNGEFRVAVFMDGHVELINEIDFQRRLPQWQAEAERFTSRLRSE